MSEILPQDTSPRKSRPRGAGLRLYRETTGAPNDEAAHADSRRVIQRFFLLLTCYRLAGNRQSIATLRQRFEDELAETPVRPARELVLSVGRADRGEDQSREEWLHSQSAEARRLLIHRTRIEIDEKTELLRSLLAEEATCG